MTPRTCARPGCNRPVAAKQLACQGDWFALSADLRSRIYEAYRQKQSGRPDSDLYYRQALVVAMHEWRDLDGR